MAINIRTISVFFLIMLTSIFVNAQSDASTSNGRPRDEPLPKPILETMAKQRIEDEKQDYDELLKRGSEAVELSKELNRSFIKNNKLTSQDKSKLKDLEKLLKKMRNELGGDGDSEDGPRMKQDSQASALRTLLKSTEKLFDEIKNTSRHTISAVAITSSNAILSILKFLRFGK